MQIRPSRPRRPFRPRAPKPEGLAHDLFPAVTGAAVALPCTMVGVEFGSRHAMRLADSVIRKGLPLVTGGHVSAQTALRALPYVSSRRFWMASCGVTLGLAGFAIGTALGIALTRGDS